MRLHPDPRFDERPLVQSAFVHTGGWVRRAEHADSFLPQTPSGPRDRPAGRALREVGGDACTLLRGQLVIHEVVDQSFRGMIARMAGDSVRRFVHLSMVS